MSEVTIIWSVYILQIVIAISLINVWIFRFGRATKYRGGESHNMKEEFSVYGLPTWFMYIVGFLKVLIALIMFVSVFASRLMPILGVPALILLSVLMLGAIAMHFKVKDTLMKTLPAIMMLSMSILAIYLVSLI